MPTIIPIPAFSDNYMDKLAALPGETRLYCGHEYTVANLRFALAGEPAIQASVSRHAGRQLSGRVAGRGWPGDLLCRAARQWRLSLASRRFVHLIPASLRRDHAGLMQRFLNLTGEV
jgi:hypothetical protein